MAPETSVSLNPIEVRFTGGMLALGRLIMTLQNNRMPVADFTLGRDANGMRATIVLDCPPETATRYTLLLSALEDVWEAGPAKSAEVVLLKTASDWSAAAQEAGVGAHEDGGMVVASGGAEKIAAFIATLGNDVQDMVRLGPVARPGDGGV